MFDTCSSILTLTKAYVQLTLKTNENVHTKGSRRYSLQVLTYIIKIVTPFPSGSLALLTETEFSRV